MLRFALISFALVACSFTGATPAPDPDAQVGGSVDAQPDALVSTDWWDLAWGARRSITVTNVGREALAGFPTLMVIPSIAAPRSGAAGEQLRLVAADQITELPFEVEDWLVQDNSRIWALLDLPANDSIVVWLYYDNPAASAASNGLAVFGNHDAVYHFNDVYSSSDPVADSAGNVDLTEVNNLASDSPEDAVMDVLGPALAIETSSDEYLTSEDAAGELIVGANDQAMIEAWFRTPNITASRTIFDNDNDLCQGLSLRITSGSLAEEGTLLGLVGIGSNCQGGLDDRVVESDTTLDDDLWHHAALILDRAAGRLEMYIDGARVQDRPTLPPGGASSNVPTRIGADFVTPEGQEWEGRLDEIRFGPIRSADWIAAAFANINPRGDRGTVTVADEELRP